MNNKMLYLKSLSPKLIKNRISLSRSYFKKESISRGKPLELAIEITNHCNADCIMCPRQKMKREKGFMDFALFKKIVDEIKDYAELVFLHFAGEPLLHPELIRMINYCGQIGLMTAFSTNAMLLDVDMSEKLIRSPLNFLVISFDGTTKRTYEKIRRKSSFEQTRSNIQKFLKIKLQSKKSPYTVISLVYQKENFNEARGFCLEWKNSGVDDTRIKSYLHYPGLDNYYGKLPRKINKSLSPCLFLWRQLGIYWDGTAVACCLDFLSQMVVGDVCRESIKDIWNGEKLKKNEADSYSRGIFPIIPLQRLQSPSSQPAVTSGNYIF